MIQAPDWLMPVLALIGVTLTAGGGVVGALIAAKVQGRATDAAKAQAEKSNEQQMIDQLQEELAGYRGRADDRMTAQDVRMTALEADNKELRAQRDTYRDYAHVLRSHIYDQLPPPPPPWPDGAPR
ncbi:hypothetical protein [Paramicrobacterium agarici]|uniref:hypothetical protein n=1 Tax=Paramicrobacterium agarici TaxID=630514 RepID=UPI0011519F93|nr:hypothetical protein [Microbacterium agarici]